MHSGQLTDKPRISVAVEDGPVSAVAMDWPAGCGGECVFLGRTRDETHPELGPLVSLEYEVYGPMAAKVLDQMAHDAAERFGCRAVRIVHAQGPVKPGEASVVIQVATPHRGEAFKACQYLIDRLKHDLPVWKREMWRDGQTFVQGSCAGEPSRSSDRNEVEGGNRDG